MAITNYDEAVKWLYLQAYVLPAYKVAEVLAVLQREHEEAERLKKIVCRLIRAWESLPEGNYSSGTIQGWLVRRMKPTIDAARKGVSDE